MQHLEVGLNSIHCNPARPEQFVVGGDDEYAYVYDIRKIAPSAASRAFGTALTAFVKPVWHPPAWVLVIVSTWILAFPVSPVRIFMYVLIIVSETGCERCTFRNRCVVCIHHKHRNEFVMDVLNTVAANIRMHTTQQLRQPGHVYVTSVETLVWCIAITWMNQRLAFSNDLCVVDGTHRLDFHHQVDLTSLTQVEKLVNKQDWCSCWAGWH